MRRAEPLFEFTTLPTEHGLPLHTILRRRFGVSRTLIRRLRTEGSVWVNGIEAPLTDSPKAGHRIEVFVPFEPTRVEPEPLPVSVLYEDRHVIVAQKPPGMLVHPTDMEPTGSFLAAVAYHLRQRGAIPFVGTVTRLDRNTSGLILIAKDPHSHYRLSRTMEAGRVHRAYLALVHGWVAPETGTIDAPIRRAAGELSRREVGEGGQRAVTHYKVLGRYEGVDQRKPQTDPTNHARVSLVRLRLETGRTHQIRVHMAHLGHPLVGDWMYGRQQIGSGASLDGECKTLEVGECVLQRQALHASELSFTHPVEGHRLEFTSSMPDDMQALIASMRSVPPSGPGSSHAI